MRGTDEERNACSFHTEILTVDKLQSVARKKSHHPRLTYFHRSNGQTRLHQPSAGRATHLSDGVARHRHLIVLGSILQGV